MRQKWRQFKCWITGGHKYKPGDTMTYNVPEKNMTCFVEQCVKCGEHRVYAVNTSALYSTYDFKLFNDF